MSKEFPKVGYDHHNVSDRLRFARQKAGFLTAADAARALKVPYGTYSGHENGSRNLRDKDVLKYAQALSISPEWLMFGREWNEGELRIAGIIKSHGDVIHDASKAPESPFSNGVLFRSLILDVQIYRLFASAYTIVGSYYSPKFEDGDLLVFRAENSRDDHRSHVGEWCLSNSGPPPVKWHFGKFFGSDGDGGHSIGVRGSYEVKNVAPPREMLFMIIPAVQVAAALESKANKELALLHMQE